MTDTTTGATERHRIAPNWGFGGARANPRNSQKPYTGAPNRDSVATTDNPIRCIRCGPKNVRVSASLRRRIGESVRSVARTETPKRLYWALGFGGPVVGSAIGEAKEPQYEHHYTRNRKCRIAIDSLHLSADPAIELAAVIEDAAAQLRDVVIGNAERAARQMH